jgi:hypothetical protein
MSQPSDKFLTDDQRMAVIVGMGLIGGVFFAKVGLEHMFVEGLTDKERKGIFVAVASGLALWGLTKMVDLQEHWYLTADTAAEKAAAEAAKSGWPTP